MDRVAAQERQRIKSEYDRRAVEISADLYAQWQPAEILTRTTRRRVAAIMMHRAGMFPRAGDKCLEVGFGEVGWLGELVSWGMPAKDLYGIELNPTRAAIAKKILSTSHLLVGDAANLPWSDNTFRLVIASTVFSSILNSEMRRMAADEITRVLRPGGALLWYDFAVNNPRNPHVRKVDRRELRRLFPQLHGSVESITLAPPLARFVAPRSWVMATVLEALPFLRTHIIALLTKAS
jgi:ubiquinone/menaquinone biosynthesis C-methylase UbiE